MAVAPEEIRALVAVMGATYERRLDVASEMTALIASADEDIEVDMPTYFAHLNQLSLGEALGEGHRKAHYYAEMLNGLKPDDVGEPVLVTAIKMLEEMGVVGSFSEEPQPVRYTVGAEDEGNRWGRIELALRKVEMPHSESRKPAIAELVTPIAVNQETAHRRHGENTRTDGAFGTKLYVGRIGVQRWVESKFAGVGDKAVEPLMDALGIELSSSPAL